MVDDKKIQWTLDLIQKLLDAKIGKPVRLHSIKNTLNDGNEVFDDDKKYLKEKFNELQEQENNPYVVNESQKGTYIRNTLHIISKLQEAEIGNHDQLETIKNSLINNEWISKKNHEYVKDKYEQLKTIDDSEAKVIERLDIVKKLQTSEIGNKEKLEKIQIIINAREELRQEDESYLQTKFEQYKKIQASNPTTSKTNPESKQTESPIKLRPFPDAKFCGICRKSVSPVRNMSTGAWILLLFIGIIPAIIYYLVKEKVCPICKHHQWEIPADDKI